MPCPVRWLRATWLLVPASFLVSGCGVQVDAPPQTTAPAAPAEHGRQPEAPKESACRCLEQGLPQCAATAEAAVEAALSRKTSFYFFETPLLSVAGYLGGKHKINVVLDPKGLEMLGVDQHARVTAKMDGIRLDHALELLLDRFGLTWTIRDGALVITAPEVAESVLTTHVYDVAELVSRGDQRGDPRADYDALCDVVVTAVAPQSWAGQAGQAAIRGATLGDAKVLIVVQTHRNHRQIADLLGQLCRIARQYGGEPAPLPNNRPSGAPR